MARNRPFHVVFECASLHFGGSERVMLEYIASLADLPVEISILFHDYPEHRPLEAELRARHPRIRHLVHVKGFWTALTSILKLRPDLMVVVWPTRPVQKALKCLHDFALAPRVVGILHEHYEYYFKELRRIAKLAEAWVLCWDFRERVRSHLGSQPTHVIHPLFSSPTSSGDLPSRMEVRLKLGIPAEAFLLGYLGRLDTNKDLSRVIRLAEHLQARMAAPVHLLMAGRPERDVSDGLREAGRLSSLSDRVHILGSQPSLQVLLPALDLHVMTSYKEGFLPFSTLQAMEQGIPVASTTVGGTPGILQNQKGVFLIQKKDDCLSVSDEAIEEAAERIAASFCFPGAGRELGLAVQAKARSLMREADSHRAVRALFVDLLGINQPSGPVPPA